VPIGTDVATAAKILQAGGLVAFPTETVYGLGADASRDDAAAKIFAVKRRPRAHPLIVHLAAGESLDGWAREIPDAARRLVERAWPGPLTIILERGPRVSRATTGGADTVGLRVPAHPMAQALLAAFGGGIAAPSANRFGAVSPTRAQHVVADLGDDVEYVLDGGACDVGVESTIVDFTRARPVLLRPGGLPREAIEAIVGPLAVADAEAPAAPGTLVSHYAPAADVIAVQPDEVVATISRVRVALAQAPTEMPASVEANKGTLAVLAPARAFAAWGDLGAGVIAYHLPDDTAAMARELYGALRDLDAAGVDVVIAALPPAAGLGEAVGDRLRRAAGPRDKTTGKR
jgi:L-threonylcarbamoyladenylate synthase